MLQAVFPETINFRINATPDCKIFSTQRISTPQGILNVFILLDISL